MTRLNFSLEGKNAVVTGAGRGLGAEIAMALADAGATVYLLSKTSGPLEEVVKKIRSAGGTAHPLLCDVLDDLDLQRAIRSIPKLDILVNNAGTNIPAPLSEVKIEDLDLLLNLNVRATFIALQTAAAKMLEAAEDGRANGAIINITSQMGHVGAASRSVYCMTKHALEGLTKAAAVELAPKGIRVNSVAPTFVDTPMTRPFFEDEKFKASVFDQLPIGRLVTTDEVAAGVVFLASDASTSITGTSLRIDGGWTAR